MTSVVLAAWMKFSGDGLHDDHSGDDGSGDHHDGDRIHGGRRDVHSAKSQSTVFRLPRTRYDPSGTKHLPTHQLYSKNPATVV